MFLRKRCPQVTCFIALGLAVIACKAIGGEQPALWKIQKIVLRLSSGKPGLRAARKCGPVG